MFQAQVNTVQPVAIAGDFASANPRSFYAAGPGGLVAGASGVTIGRFAWLSTSSIDSDAAPSIANSFGSGSVGGLIHRAQQGLATAFLAEGGMVIPQGFPVELSTSGDYWIKNEGSTQAIPGQIAYATYTNGAATFAASGSPAAGGSGTASTIAAGTGSFTASISGNVLTITIVGSGVAYPGGLLSGTNVVTGTTIVSQLSGAAGGVGTYSVSIGEQTVASTTVSETYGLLTIGGTVTGTVAVGQAVTTGASAGTAVTALGTGTGGAGTYIVNNTQTVGSTTISTSSNVATKWFALSSALPGELVKVSSQSLG